MKPGAVTRRADPDALTYDQVLAVHQTCGHQLLGDALGRVCREEAGAREELQRGAAATVRDSSCGGSTDLGPA